MSIREIINQSGALPPSATGKKTKEPGRALPDKGDKVELSSEARSLFKAEQEKRLSEIQKRIDEKFYFRKDVTEQVVDALMQDLMK
jgi:hypothetical protein